MKKQRLKTIIGFLMAGVCGISMLGGCGKAEVSVTQSEETVDAVLPEDQELQYDYTTTEGLKVEPGTYVAVVVKGLRENNYWEIIHQGVEAAVADVNAAMGFEGDAQVKLTFEGPAEETNEEEQINTLDAVLAENPTVLCLAAIDMESCQPQLETAMDNGIPVLTLDAGINSNLVLASCQTDNVAAAKAGCEKLCEKLNGKGKIAMIAHQPGTETFERRVEGIQAALEKYPDVELVCTLEENAEVTMPEQLAKMQAQYPDLDGIIATNEANSSAVLEVYKDVETAPLIVGFDNGEEQIQAIQEGREYGCICQNPFSMGYAVVIAALRAAVGEEIDELIDSGYMWIDQTNIDLPENQIYLYQ